MRNATDKDPSIYILLIILLKILKKIILVLQGRVSAHFQDAEKM